MRCMLTPHGVLTAGCTVENCEAPRTNWEEMCRPFCAGGWARTVAALWGEVSVWFTGRQERGRVLVEKLGLAASKLQALSSQQVSEMYIVGKRPKSHNNFGLLIFT